MRQRVLAPVTFDALVLGTNLLTGIMVARSLGPSGRGELAAILALVQTATWVFSLGSREAISFYHARDGESGARLIASWMLVTIPLGILAVIAGELILPVLFSAQTAEAIELARVYMLVVVVLLVGTVFNGILLGDQRFLAYNLVRWSMPVVTALGYVALLGSGAMSVPSALWINAAASVLATIAGAAICVNRHGLGRLDPPLLRTTLAYGARAHGGLLAGFISARLDLLIIPAFLSAASVGLYSVATNVGSIIATLTGTIAIVVLPIASRDEKRSARTVIRTMHAALAIGGCIGLLMFVFAEVALVLVYGSAFEPASTALRILVPGEVLAAGAAILLSGLLAANRPLLSSLPSIPSALLTIGGLTIFLQSGGITAAAIVTSCAYSLVFVLALIIYRRVAKLSWKSFLRPPAA